MTRPPAKAWAFGRRPPRLFAWVAALILALAVTGASLQAQTTPVPSPGPSPAPTSPATPPRVGPDGGLLKGTPGTAPAPGGEAARPVKSISITPAVSNAPDYGAWDKLASRAEAALGARETSNQGLELLRSQLVDWRSAFQGAQTANSARIATLRTQVETLGPPPADGVIEAEEIAARRKALTDQLVRLQAPGIAAEEAYTRADGLIREIDRVLRERQASALLKLWPTALNPANWPLALKGLTTSALGLYTETREVWTGPRAGRDLRDNLPAILLLLILGGLAITRGRRWVRRGILRLGAMGPERGRRLWEMLASLSRIALPVAGMAAFSQALVLSGLLGAEGKDIARFLPDMALIIVTAIWLGWRLFPPVGGQGAEFHLPAEGRAEGRFHCYVLGLMQALEALRVLVFPPGEVGEAATSVLSLPILVIAGLSLMRLSALLRQHVRAETAEGEGVSYRDRVVRLSAQGALLIGALGPLLAAVGYISAAAALVHPAALSLALLGGVFILQEAVSDIYVVLFRGERGRQFALLPVLVSFAFSLAALPILALIWGARADDLWEIWARFREGFQMGETRISPTDFLYFALIFGFGFALTRLFQGALKSTILPKTRLDTGGQNAIVAGTGYLGIFLAALIAINAVGVDLSGLAIVAGALSVGIGFGLQNIVSNFVSGIILLIERPVSEGDWIEVGTVSGIVKAISVRSTRIQTFDRSDVIVPNADLVAQRVTNWTRYNLTGRLIVPVNVVHGSDPGLVERVLREIAESQPLAILNPPPTIALVGFSMDALQFEIRLILRDVNFNLQVRSEVNRAILRRFAEEGIVLAHTPNPAAPPPPREGGAGTEGALA